MDCAPHWLKQPQIPPEYDGEPDRRQHVANRSLGILDEPTAYGLDFGSVAMYIPFDFAKARLKRWGLNNAEHKENARMLDLHPIARFAHFISIFVQKCHVQCHVA